jgi:hypothetical protein
MAEKMVATILGITDLGEVQLAEGGSEEQIELEIQVQQGAPCLGKRVRLAGPGYAEEAEFRSCKMLRKPDDPSWAPHGLHGFFRRQTIEEYPDDTRAR